MWQTSKRIIRDVSGCKLQASSFISKPAARCLWLAAVIFLIVCQICLAQDKFVYEDKGRRDPFISLVTPDGRILNLEPSGKDAKITLEGIIYDEAGDSYAIINNEVVGTGDYIAGYSVVRIEVDKVILSKDNKTVEFILEKEELWKN